eukprot:GHVU01060801.1.p2 GENE.GHVU01060801.1~~GHVU01060801.1.p2  ORF type:complete len:111 (-),score=3.70 GHVU01060801.1:90-422(-)
MVTQEDTTPNANHAHSNTHRQTQQTQVILPDVRRTCICCFVLSRLNERPDLFIPESGVGTCRFAPGGRTASEGGKRMITQFALVIPPRPSSCQPIASHAIRANMINHIDY